MKSYAVVIEKTATGYGAHVPDLPGCIAAAETLDAARQLITEAVEFHLEGMAEATDALQFSIRQILGEEALRYVRRR